MLVLTSAPVPEWVFRFVGGTHGITRRSVTVSDPTWSGNVSWVVTGSTSPYGSRASFHEHFGKSLDKMYVILSNHYPKCRVSQMDTSAAGSPCTRKGGESEV